MIISNIARPVELNIKYRYAVQYILNSKKYKQTVTDLMLFCHIRMQILLTELQNANCSTNWEHISNHFYVLGFYTFQFECFTGQFNSRDICLLTLKGITRRVTTIIRNAMRRVFPWLATPLLLLFMPSPGLRVHSGRRVMQS